MLLGLSCTGFLRPLTPPSHYQRQPHFPLNITLFGEGPWFAIAVIARVLVAVYTENVVISTHVTTHGDKLCYLQGNDESNDGFRFCFAGVFVLVAEYYITPM